MPRSTPMGVTPRPSEESCPRCARVVETDLPFCGHCGTRVILSESMAMCSGCGASFAEGIDVYCSRCGQRVGQRVGIEEDLEVRNGELWVEQLRADASVRDSFHLSPARNVQIGRESGDWVFPYDQTMSGRHAEIRSQDAEFYVRDCGSRNGVALAVRGERAVRKGQRVLVGDQILRNESITT